jgi:hypothetical protein
MGKNLEIEDIEDMRSRVGIHDVDLWQAIRRLRAGDCVRLTFLGGEDSPGGETLRVRITRVRGADFCGTLTEKPTSRGLSFLDVGSAVVFKASQIHSLADRRESVAKGSPEPAKVDGARPGASSRMPR